GPAARAAALARAPRGGADRRARAPAGHGRAGESRAADPRADARPEESARRDPGLRRDAPGGGARRAERRAAELDRADPAGDPGDAQPPGGPARAVARRIRPAPDPRETDRRRTPRAKCGGRAPRHG